ncbi:hypothetical protein CAPGI0001_2479 [Capnocytophaga gingivalis ATCC 33624]|nr:hypothetical protein CAPGI0001_2479 [Capnocytophaga gingivalis ATCC 33624]
MPKISVIPRGNKYFRLFDYYRKVVLKLPLLTLSANNYGIGLITNILENSSVGKETINR